MLALRQVERETCSCGWHKSLTSDKSNGFQIEADVCPVCQNLDRYARVLHDEDDRIIKAMGENAPAGAARPSDGRRIYTRMLSAGEMAEKRASRSERRASA